MKHYVEIARQVALAGGAEALKYFRSKSLIVASRTQLFHIKNYGDKKQSYISREGLKD